MGGGNEKMEIKVARVGVSDSHRSVFLNRGMFVKAPPSFFEFYGQDFSAPNKREREDLEKYKGVIKLRDYSDWVDPRQPVMTPKAVAAVEVPPPEPTIVGRQEVLAQEVKEPVAEEKPEVVAAPEGDEQPLGDITPKKKTSSRRRTVTIKKN